LTPKVASIEVIDAALRAAPKVIRIPRNLYDQGAEQFSINSSDPFFIDPFFIAG
jgi:hypothetical protein